MLFAFGLEPPVKEWAKAHNADHLMQTGGEAFIQRLDEVLANEDNDFMWQLDCIDLQKARAKIGLFIIRDLDNCGYTNWELWTFWERPHLHARTTWWRGDDVAENPMEDW